MLFFTRSCALFGVPAESDGEPEDDLAEGDNAESQTEAKESTEVGNEVKDCHAFGDLVLCRRHYYALLLKEHPCKENADRKLLMLQSRGLPQQGRAPGRCTRSCP